MNKTLVLFDFDGTITSKDSMLLFLKFYAGQSSFIANCLKFVPQLLLWKAGVLPTTKAKSKLFKIFFSGADVATFDKKCEDFTRVKLPQIIKKSAMDKLAYHVNEKHKVFIISASAENWIKPWCDTLNQVTLIATRLKNIDGKLSGEIEGENCKGKEKVRRLMQKIDLNHYDTIVAYGDSSGDKEMLQIATDGHYRNFS